MDQSIVRRIGSRLLCVLMAAAMFAAAVSAQATGSTSVRGVVSDSKGDAIAGATVVLINEEKGGRRTATTNERGAYSFPNIETGTFRLEIEATGFKKSVVSKIVGLVDKPTDANVSLEIGNISEVVNVTGEELASIVNVTDASTGNNFVARQLLGLPLNARNVATLLSLQPGVTEDGSTSGGRRDQANITLDGVDVNNQQQGLDVVGGTAFAPVLRVNPDSVDEFRVTTLNADATKGRSSGAQVSLITKSGSNDFHGALYEYHRNHATAANDWFNNASGVDRPKLIRNLFGGRIGGPIVKDRFFFFYNYEGMREAKDTGVTRLVPRASLAAGSIRFDDTTGQSWTLTTAQINAFTLTGVPVIDVNPAVTSLFAGAASRYPVNDDTLGDGRNTGGFRFNAPVPVEQNMHTARFDLNLTRDQSHTLSFRGNYQQDLTGAAPYFPDTPPTNTWSHPLGMAATYTWMVRPNLTNRFNYGLTRLAFSDQGDSNLPSITFRSVFSPTGFTRAINRVNPTHNFTDDVTWIKGAHTVQVGTNIRLISNSRENYANAFDTAITNFSWSASNIARTAVNQYITSQVGSSRSVASGWSTPLQHALVALFGRLNDYRANYNFDISGAILPANQGIKRIFKTEEYDFYAQDSWKIRPNLSVNIGLRYGLSMPVYESQGYEAVPSIPLGQYLQNTIQAMANGQNYREIIRVDKAKDGFYKIDKNNWQPRISAVWSPDFGDGVMAKIFGAKDKAVLRGGFAITNDYFGQQLAVTWDNNNELGFSSSSSLPTNTYNITTNPGVLYTGSSMNIRSFPGLSTPSALTFPLTYPQSTPGNGDIQRSLDSDLQSPVNYSWSLTYGRELPGRIWLDVGYQARLARHLLIGRDAVALRGDIRDRVSGTTYFQAATVLDKQLQAGIAGRNVAPVAFFENMWAPGTLRTFFGCPADAQGNPLPTCTNTQAVYNAQPGYGDWTYMMTGLDGLSGSRYFFQGQYDSLAVFSTVGSSDYHGGFATLRQRLGGVTWDFNYTFSKSLDQASGLQNADSFGSAFVLNAFNIHDQRSYSDFDIRHMMNFNGVWDIPVGRDRRFGKGNNKFVDALIGGWSLSGLFRWHSGYPFDGFYDATGWQTNWNIRSYMTQLNPVTTGTFYNADGPNLFADPAQAVKAWRTPHPGETGTRNPIRLPNTWNIDMGIAKSFNMPWREGHKVTFRADSFNVTNTPFFDGQSVGTLGYTGSAAPPNFGKFTGMSNSPRVFQFALRYDF